MPEDVDTPFNLPVLTSEEEAELEALRSLPDAALWEIIREQMPEISQKHMQELMSQNTKGTISTESYERLAEFVEWGERLILRKSEARAILSQRGFQMNRP